MADIARAAEAGSHSAVMKGRELLGRHIGALNDRASFGAEELKAFAWLGAAMQKLEDSSSGSPLHEVEGLPARELADSQPASMQDSSQARARGTWEARTRGGCRVVPGEPVAV